MATDFIKDILHPNTANVLTYLLLGENYIDLSDFYYIKPIQEDIEECMKFLPPDVIQKDVTNSNGLKISVIDKAEFEKFLKTYINAYKEDNLNLKVTNKPPISIYSRQNNEYFYSYSENLLQMNEILKSYQEGKIINLSSYKVLEKSPLIRFAEIILDIYFNLSLKRKPYVEIIECKQHYYPKNRLSSYIVLNLAMKLKKTPIEIYKELLFKYSEIVNKSKKLCDSYEPQGRFLKFLYRPKDVLKSKNVYIYLNDKPISLSFKEYSIIYELATGYKPLYSNIGKHQVIISRINTKVKKGLSDSHFNLIERDCEDDKYILGKYVGFDRARYL